MGIYFYRSSTDSSERRRNKISFVLADFTYGIHRGRSERLVPRFGDSIGATNPKHSYYDGNVRGCGLYFNATLPSVEPKLRKQPAFVSILQREQVQNKIGLGFATWSWIKDPRNISPLISSPHKQCEMLLVKNRFFPIFFRAQGIWEDFRFGVTESWDCLESLATRSSIFASSWFIWARHLLEINEWD